MGKSKAGEQRAGTNTTGAQPGESLRHRRGATVFEVDFDPEGWMSERPRYWQDLEPAEPPTRLAWLRHRAREAAAALLGAPADPWAQPSASEEEWIRLSETALGPLPRPARTTPSAAPKKTTAKSAKGAPRTPGAALATKRGAAAS